MLKGNITATGSDLSAAEHTLSFLKVVCVHHNYMYPSSSHKTESNRKKKQKREAYVSELTEAMQPESKPLSRWLSGEPEGQQRKQNAHDIS